MSLLAWLPLDGDLRNLGADTGLSLDGNVTAWYPTGSANILQMTSGKWTAINSADYLYVSDRENDSYVSAVTTSSGGAYGLFTYKDSIMTYKSSSGSSVYSFSGTAKANKAGTLKLMARVGGDYTYQITIKTWSLAANTETPISVDGWSIAEGNADYDGKAVYLFFSYSVASAQVYVYKPKFEKSPTHSSWSPNVNALATDAYKKAYMKGRTGRYCLSSNQGSGTAYSAYPHEATNSHVYEFTEPFTVSMWLNHHYIGSSNAYAVSVGNKSDGWHLRLNNATTVTFHLGAQSVALSAKQDTWNHLTVVYDGTNLIGYVNGVKGNTTAVTAVPTYAAGSVGLLIGAAYNSATAVEYPGAFAMNDLRIYDHAASQMEILDAYRTLLVHYKFDDKPTSTSSVADNDNLITGINGGTIKFLMYNGQEDNSSRDWSTEVTASANSVFGMDKDGWISLKSDFGNCDTNTATTFTARQLGTHYFRNHAYAQAPIKLTLYPNWYRLIWETDRAYSYSMGTMLLVDSNDLVSNEGGTRSTIVNQYTTQPFKTKTKSNASFSVSSKTDVGIALGICSGMRVRLKLETYGDNSIGAYTLKGECNFPDVSGRLNNGRQLGCPYEYGSSDTEVYNYNICTKTAGESVAVEVPDPMNSDMPEYTIASWVKIRQFASGESATLWCGRDSYTVANGAVFVGANAITFDCDGERLTVSTTIATGTWYHICCTWKKGVSKRIYINGSLAQSQTSTGSHSRTAGKTGYIGMKTGSDNALTTTDRLQGAVQDFRIYGTALGEEDVLALYNVREAIDNAGVVYAKEFIEE